MVGSLVMQQLAKGGKEEQTEVFCLQLWELTVVYVGSAICLQQLGMTEEEKH